MSAGGPAGAEYAKAILIPILLHTLFDASSGANYLLNDSNDAAVIIGIAVSLAGMIAMFVLQILLIRRLRENVETFCAEITIPASCHIFKILILENMTRSRYNTLKGRKESLL